MSLNFGFNVGVRSGHHRHRHPEIEISFKFIPKILSKECIIFLTTLYIAVCEGVSMVVGVPYGFRMKA